MKLLKLEKLKNSSKKYKATFQTDSGKTKSTSFGASGMRDFTLMSNPKSKFYIKEKEKRETIRNNYLKRHKKDLKTNDPTRAGYLSYYLLWGESKSIRENLKNYKKRFNL